MGFNLLIRRDAKYATNIIITRIISNATPLIAPSKPCSHFSPDCCSNTLEIAGKTGTTQKNSDGWFMGIAPKLATGVWVGWEDRATHFYSTGEGQGAKMALPIWGYFMKKVYADKSLGILPEDKFIKPANWTGQCSDLNSMGGGYGDDGGLRTIDEIKNPTPPKTQHSSGPKKEDNVNENLNSGDDIDFNK